MHLILDLGNTNHKLAIVDREQILHLEVVKRVNRRFLKELLEKFPGVDQGIVSSVVPLPTSALSFLKEVLNGFIVLCVHTPVPVINRYGTPETLGKDRLASAVAGSSLFEKYPVLVINAGTCITYDLITAYKEYLGGAISPGIYMRFKGLHTFTSKLPLINLQEDVPLIGSDTKGSILSGVIHGVISEISGMIQQYQQVYPSLQVILSGGDAVFLEKRLKNRIFAFPNIVIIGLNQILEYNLQHAH